jgi:hypothetical protein
MIQKQTFHLHLNPITIFLPHRNDEMTLLLNYVCKVDSIHHYNVGNLPPKATLNNFAQRNGLYFDTTENFELRVQI